MSLMSCSGRLVLGCVCFAFVVIVAIDGTIEAQQKHPAEDKGAKSVKSDFTSSLRFVNNGAQAVKLYWLDYEGKRVLIAQLQAGDSFEIAKALLNHPYVVADEKDNALGLYYADAQARTVVLGGPPPGTQPKGGGFGKGGFGKGGGGFKGATTPSTFKGLQHALVQEEIKLDKNQLVKLGDLVKKDAEARDGLKGAPPAEAAKKRADIVKDSDAAALALLTPVQTTRLAQIKRQQLDSAIFADPQLMQALKLTPEQQDKFAALRTDFAAQTKGNTAPGKGPNPSLDPGTLFDFYAKGRTFFLISETRAMKDTLEQYAKDKGITDGQITRAQFLDYYQSREGTDAKRIVETRSAMYNKAQAVLDASQKKVWQELVGAPCKNYLPAAVFNLTDASQPDFGGGFGGFGKNSTPSTFKGLQNPLVQEEIKLDKDQLGKLADLIMKEIDARPAGVSAAEAKKREDAALALLTPAQITRILQIKRQHPIGAIWSNTELMQALKLSPEQQTQFADLKTESTTRVSAAAVGANTDQYQKQLVEIRAALHGKAQALLEPAQKKIWQEFVGEPCKNYMPASVFSAPDAAGGSKKDGKGKARGPDTGYTFNNYSVVPTRFLNEKSVQEDLKLTPEQARRVADMLGAGTKAKTAPLPPDLLTPAQIQRVQGIYLQQAMMSFGPAGAFRWKEVQDLLNLSEVQKEQILVIGAADAKVIAALAKESTPIDMQKVRALDKATQEKLNGVLSVDQRGKLKGLLGEPFTGQISNPYRAGVAIGLRSSWSAESAKE